MDVNEAFSLISRAIDVGRPAHGYLIVGEIRGDSSELVSRLLAKLFPDTPEQVANRSHPDIITLEPQGRSRTIKVMRGKEDSGPGMRDGFIEPMSVTAFSGGWKVGIVSGADRLQPEAANAFLKMLEEPPSQTLFLLLTDAPDAILPTIISRTQRIDLPFPPDILEGEDYEAVATAFAAKDVAALVAKLKDLKDEADDPDVPMVRKTYFRTLMSFVRAMMVDGRLPRYQAFRNVEAVESAYHRVDRFIPDESVIFNMMNAIVFPA